jgi:hypothetical protein
MFSRLSRFLTRSKHRKKPHPLDQRLPLPPSHRSSLAPTRHYSTSSGHSSSCTIEPYRAPSFLEIVCNDSQPVYCMETVPLFHPASLPPGTRKANSLYESAHEEILRERIRCVAAEEEERRQRRAKRKRISGLSRGVLWSERPSGREDIARRSNEEFPRRSGQEEYLRQDVQEFARRGQVQQGNEPRMRRQSIDHGRADSYGSMDCYYGPPIYHDPSRYQNTIPETSRYKEPSRQYHQDRQHRPPVPTHPGPFRIPHADDYKDRSHHHRSIPVDPYITRTTSIRQSLFPQTCESPYYHPDFRSRRMDPEIPQTRVTRLKQPARTFWRDDGVASDIGIGSGREIGIGLGRISGMAASRSIASPSVRSDVVLTPTPSSSWRCSRPPSERRFADQVFFCSVNVDFRSCSSDISRL